MLRISFGVGLVRIMPVNGVLRFSERCIDGALKLGGDLANSFLGSLWGDSAEEWVTLWHMRIWVGTLEA